MSIESGNQSKTEISFRKLECYHQLSRWRDMESELAKLQLPRSPKSKEEQTRFLLNELTVHKHAAAAAIGTHNWGELKTRATALKEIFENSDLNIDEDATYYQGLAAVVSYACTCGL